MKKLLCIFTVLLCTAISLVAETKVEVGPIPDWQKPIMEKVTFDVKTRTLGQILGAESDKTATPSFLVFTAEATENLGKRLLWVDAEVEFSNGAVRKFENVSFFLITKGIEADVRKLDDVGFVGPGDEPGDQKKFEIKKLKILNAACK